MKMSECVTKIKDSEASYLKVSYFQYYNLDQFILFKTWIANEDNSIEGEWTNWYTGEVGTKHIFLILF